MLYNSFCTCVIRDKESRNLPFRYDGTGFLFKYVDKLVLFLNKFLVDKIGKDQELLVLMKDTNENGTVTKVIIADRESFFFDTKINHNVAISILENKFETSLFRLEDNYSPPFPFNNSIVNILAIDNDNPRKSFANFDATSPYELKEFSGKVSFINESLTISSLGDIESQHIVFLENDSVNFESQISQGGIVFIRNNENEFPIGITNALIRGSLRSFIGTTNGYYWSFTHLYDVLKLLKKNHMISYNNTYNNLVEYYIDNVSELRDKVEYFSDELITKKISDLDINSPLNKFMSDNMIELRGELFSLRFNLFMIEQNLIDKDWWNFSHKNSPPDDNRKLFLIKQFQKTIIRSFIIGFFSVIEHFLRAALRRIDSELLNNATANFYHIRNHYLESIEYNEEERLKYETVLKLFSLIRNTIHNDGYYYTNRDEDRIIEIEYNEKLFRFVVGDKFEAQYEDYFSLIEDTIEFLWFVFKSDYLNNNFH